MTDAPMPPLPVPWVNLGYRGANHVSAYTADQMHAYARAYAEQETEVLRERNDELHASLSLEKSSRQMMLDQLEKAEQETAILAGCLGLILYTLED